MIITIDGPAASGKSFTARALAQRLNMCHINSGLLYRALAYLLKTYAGYDSLSISSPDHVHVDTYVDHDRFVYQCMHGTSSVLFDGNDITPELTSDTISTLASIMSTNWYVRERLLATQRALATQYDCVIDGRDAGSVVFPEADSKFFLTASLEVRAQRWLDDQERKGNQMRYQQAYDQIAMRDARDSGRVVAPLIVPAGAHLIDNSDLTQEQTIALMMEQIKKLQ